ncbi:MAG: PaaI family thioesterase [Deltaproteobacteria bacterium]|jgi:uncharacterized protein (TIGR00369 family)|nr:PaaI family thioesterase [Deltaproteobacteria bacterium]
MRNLNPEYIDAVEKHVNSCPYFSLLSMQIKGLGWGDSLLEILVEEKHLQPFGMVHGGVFASLIDAAAFWAVYTQIPEELGMTTVELKLNYLAPLSTGRMMARGKSLRVGKTLCLGEASILNEEGTLLAHGTSTMMILKDLKIQGVTEGPSKYLD